jgi:hypothetical protein
VVDPPRQFLPRHLLVHIDGHGPEILGQLCVRPDVPGLFEQPELDAAVADVDRHQEFPTGLRALSIVQLHTLLDFEEIVMVTWTARVSISLA